MHKQVIENGIMPKAFPISLHKQNFVDYWIDEMRFEDMEPLSKIQKVYLYNAGVMMNGRIYSIDVTPRYEPFIPLGKIFEQGMVYERYFLREEDMPNWIYSKGAKHEQHQRRDGSMYWFSEGFVSFPESIDKPSRIMLTSETQVGRTLHVVTDLQTGSECLRQ